MSVTFHSHLACRRGRGFTMIEAMFVVTLLAILSTIAIPSFRTLMANNRVSSAQSELQALLLYARAEATYRRMGMGVSMDTHRRHWKVFPASIDGSGTVTATGDAVRETQLPETLEVVSDGNNMGQAAVYFDAAGKAKFQGTPPARFVRILEPSATYVRCLQVSANGLVRRPACT